MFSLRHPSPVCEGCHENVDDGNKTVQPAAGEHTVVLTQSWMILLLIGLDCACVIDFYLQFIIIELLFLLFWPWIILYSYDNTAHADLWTSASP